ncbi:MAG TPA: nickel-binding protein [Chthoniobacterales bacterium]|nr:nickel-binding protein [Chthoniobacterales bacterium]
MPYYMDIHEIHGCTADDVAKAHLADMDVQEKYGVKYGKYWFNESCGKIFCLCEAPNEEAAIKVHREAHGLVADKLIEVQPELIEGFLGGGGVNPAGAALLPGETLGQRDPGIRTVLFTDIVESTSLTQKLGDDRAMELLHTHDTIVRDALTACNGREVKHTGDGIMASFVSAASAVRCATQIQRELARQDEEDWPIKVRIGGAAGEPVERDKDIFGSTVQLAARLCSHAEPDQILVSNVVADLCIGKGLHFHPLGEMKLKGFDKPVAVSVVHWPGHVHA